MSFSFHNICIEYHSHRVVSNVSASIDSGQLLYVQGSNGSGKTTLLKALAGLLPLAEGQINPPNTHPTPIFLLGHQLGLKQGFTLNENWRWLSKIYNCPMPSYADIKYLGLTQHTPILAQQLSMGQRKKALIAFCWQVNTSIWLLDEPLTNCDQRTQELFYKRLEQHLAEGGMALMTSHDIHPLPIPHQTLSLQEAVCSA